MAVSAAEFFEVRWRVKGANEAWSAPRRIAPTGEIVVTELDRTQQYEFEVRAVSNCGAKSIWVPSDYTVPGAVPPVAVDTLTAQSLADGVHLGWTSIATPAAGIEYSVERSANGTGGWSERARLRATAYTDPETSGAVFYYRVRGVNFAGQYGAYSPVVSSKGVSVGAIGTNAANALADAAAAQFAADQANAELFNIASDNMLAAGEKTTVIRDYNVISAEQAGIDAQATSYSITTQKTAYDNAVATLTTYLDGLTSPTAWDNVTGDTAIVGTTFRSRFANVYTTRQTLLNAIYAAAKAKADAAQATADTAQFLASQVAVINPGFDAGDMGWTKASGWSIKSDGSFAHGQGYAEKYGGGSSASLRNNAVCFVQPGKSYTVQALIKAIGANGQCYARISWRDLNDNEVGLTNGNLITGTTVAGSYATGQAPAGAVFAHAEIAATSHTAGRYQVDNVISTLQPATADEIAESGGRKWAAQSGADKTSSNTSADTAHVAGATAAAVSDGAGRAQAGLDGNGYLVQNKHSLGLLKDRSLDNIADGGGRYAAAEAGADKTRNHVSLGPNAIVNPSGKDGTVTPNYVDSAGTLTSYVHDSNLRPSETAGGSLMFTGTIGAQSTIYFNGRTYSSNIDDAVMVSAHPGEVWCGRIRAGDWGGGNIGTGRLLVQFRNAAGTYLNGGGLSQTPSDSDLMEYVVFAVAPANTARVELAFRFYMDATNTVALLQQAELRKATPADKGSGVQLGDARNQAIVTVGNFGSAWQNLSVTYSSTATSATVTVSAANLQVGSQVVHYNSSSYTRAGTAGQAVKVYLYYLDPDYSGGSKSIQGSAFYVNTINNDGAVYVATITVTYPTSGSGTGGGSSGGNSCPDENAWVLRADPERDFTIRAKDVAVGDYLRLTDGRAGRVTYSQRTASPRVRVVGRCQKSLTCSPSAPLEKPDGSHVCAIDAAGHDVRIVPPMAALADMIDRVETLHDGFVQHITCEDANFWTGDDPDCLFAHHNLKPIPDL